MHPLAAGPCIACNVSLLKTVSLKGTSELQATFVNPVVEIAEKRYQLGREILY